MKKILNILLAAALSGTLLTGCEDVTGDAGNGKVWPFITIYESTAAKAYQVGFRATFNSHTDAVYILTETSFAREAYIAENGEEAYWQYVRENGEAHEGSAPVEYLTDNDLKGYITTTIVADGKGGPTVKVLDKNCFSTSLALLNLMQEKTGDWDIVAEVSITEDLFNKQGQTGEGYLLHIENTDLYMIPFPWFFAWDGDMDFQDCESLIVRLDPETLAPLGVSTTTISTGFDDQAGETGSREIGFGYSPALGCTFTYADGVYTLSGVLLYNDKVGVAGGEPISATISWEVIPAEAEEE